MPCSPAAPSPLQGWTSTSSSKDVAGPIAFYQDACHPTVPYAMPACSYVSDYSCEAFKALCQHNLLRARPTRPPRSCPPAALEWQATKEQKGISLSVKYPDGESPMCTGIQCSASLPLSAGIPHTCIQTESPVGACVLVSALGESLWAAAEAWTSADELGQTLAKRK